MPHRSLKQNLRTWMLPIAMLGGILFHNFIGYLEPISPYLIAIMLLLTYCRINRSEIRITRFTLWLVGLQLSVSFILYLIFSPMNQVAAQCLFICIFCPVATAAPVITGMLGGSIPRVATLSITSNIAVALLAPFLFTYIGAHGHGSNLPFLHVTGLISLKVIPLILGPLLLAWIFEIVTPKIHHTLARHQGVSFYIWAVSLFIVVGNAVRYVINHLRQQPDEGYTMALLAGISLLVCCLQFFVGRRIGARYGDKVAGAQGLGQKNTVLAIWMALTFLNPIVSVGPAAYVAWQNTINSIQLWLKNRQA